MTLIVYAGCLFLLLCSYGLLVYKEPSRLILRAGEMRKKWGEDGAFQLWLNRGKLPKINQSQGFFIQMVQKRKKDRAEKDMIQGIAYLRNAVAMGRGEQISVDLLLEELAALGGCLSSTYYSMLHYLRLNDKEKAMDLMKESICSEQGRDYARLLLQWEELPPTMLMETLTSYQKTMKEMEITKQKRQDELISDLIYLPVILNVMVVLINFIYVAYFIDQRDALLLMVG